MDLKKLTIATFAQKLRKKEFSAAEVTRAYLDEIKKHDEKIGAYLSVDEERAIEKAGEVDEAVAAGQELSVLAGVPIAVKDVILIEGSPATGASKILEHYTASYDATVIQKLKAHDAVFLGKTNCDEFAMGSSTENSAYKTTRNPHDLERVAGGSSGGSAAAVAANMALAALGTDTGGSIRQPASLCGVVGLKPTYGAVSRSGVMSMAASLYQAGPIAKTVEDAAYLFDAMRGIDPLDATTCAIDYGKELLTPDFGKMKDLKVGLPREYFIDGIDAETKKAVDDTIAQYESLGIEFEKISLPHTKYALSTYYIIMPAEVSADVARYDGIRYSPSRNIEKSALSLLDLYFKNRGLGFGAEVKRRIILGTFVLSSGYYDAYYNKAQNVRQLIREDFEKAFENVDVILTPVSPTTAFKVGEKTDDPLTMYLADVFTLATSLAGLPGISIPAKTSGLPVGFQLIGRHFRESDILGLGRLYEDSLK
jgi:aspartyl-tRNA(Asn)/glutamyl-tRNA(Gln) amidotransferase subunit A